MEKFGNDTFKYNGKLYKVVKKEKGHRCSETCSLYNELDGACGNICSEMYEQLKNPEFTYEDAVLVEVAPGEAAIENDEIDYKALYEETISRLKIAKENVGCYTFSEVIDKVIPEVAESEDERIMKELIEMVRLSCTNGDDIDKKIAWLEKRKESKATWSEEDEDRVKTVLYILHEVVDNHNFDEWLKSLKDRVAWRPTEEQMKALGDAIFDAEYDHRLTEMGALLSLDKDLKKL